MMHLALVHVLCAENPDYLYLLAANRSLTGFAAPGCPAVCVVDGPTNKLARESGFRLQDWVNEVIVVEAPYPSAVLNSRYLKTTLRSHVRGDFLFLDLDAIIVSQRLFSKLPCRCLGASQNLDHVNLKDQFPADIAQAIYEPMGWEHPFLPYVNSGVLFCRDNPECHALFGRWHELWKRQREQLGIHLDQPALNRALWETPRALTVMPRVFNSPVDVGPEFEAEAWVYHYYISVYSGVPRAESLLAIASQEIQRRGKLSKSLLRWMVEQKHAFLPLGYSIKHALKQGLWSRAYNLWRERNAESARAPRAQAAS